MAEQSWMGKQGFRSVVLGDNAYLAFAAPAVDGDQSYLDAHSGADRMGFYFDRTPAAEKMVLVVLGTDRLAVSVNGVEVTGDAQISGRASVNSSATRGGLNIAQGTTPSAPSDGDFWVESGGVFAKRGGTTVQLDGGLGGSIATGQVAFGSATNVISGNNKFKFSASTGLNVNMAATGLNNVTIGEGSGTSLSSGFSNVIIGTDAGSSLTTEGHHVIIGYHAGQFMSAGGDTVAIGFNAGYTTSGQSCVIIGSQANSTTADETIVIGHNAQVTASGAYQSITIGAGAFAQHFQAICIGASANSKFPNSFTAGSPSAPINNVFFGRGATDASATGYTISGTIGVGTDKVGGDLNLSAGSSTGSGTGGVLNFFTARPTGSSATVNSALVRLSVLADGGIDWTGLATTDQPAVSAANHGTIYYDSTAQAFYYSANGAAYTTFGGGGGGGIGGSIAADQVAVGSGTNTIAGSSGLVWTATDGLSSNRTAAARNELFGFGAGNASISGTDNTLVGDLAGAAITSATRTTGIGSSALNALLSGQDCTAIGYHALLLAKGTRNTAGGSKAGDAITTGINNTAWGVDALGIMTTNSDSVGIGYQAGLGATGGQNVFIGSGAGATSTTHSNMVVIGYGASSGPDGDQGVAIGAGAVLDGGDGHIAIGYGASCSQASTQYAIALGNGAAASADYSIAIGYSTTVDIANTLVVGSPIAPINTVYFGKGLRSSTATAYSIAGTQGSGTDKVGGNLMLTGGRSTGAGTPGSVIIRTAPASASGTLVNVVADRLVIAGDGGVTWVGILTVSAPALSPANCGTIYYDQTAQTFYYSANGSAYAAFGGGGGGIGGSIAINQVAYGSGTNTIAGSANMTYDGTTFNVNGSSTSPVISASSNSGARYVNYYSYTTFNGFALSYRPFYASYVGSQVPGNTETDDIVFSSIYAAGSPTEAFRLVNQTAGLQMTGRLTSVNATAASSTITGAVQIGDASTAATNVGIGGGYIFAGAGISGATITATGLTATRLPVVSTGGLLTDFASLHYTDTNTRLFVTGLTTTDVPDIRAINDAVVIATIRAYGSAAVGSLWGTAVANAAGAIAFGTPTTAYFVGTSGSVAPIIFGIGTAEVFRFTSSTADLASPNQFTVANTTDSTTTATGSITTLGGIGIAKAVVVGTSISLAKQVDWAGVATVSAPPLSAANHGSIYYDSTAQAFYYSANGAAYAPLSGGGITGTLTSGRVTVGSGTSTVTDFAGLTYSSANGLSSNRNSVTGCEFFGFNAGNATQSVQGNTGVGNSALASLTTGIFNTALGYKAGTALTGTGGGTGDNVLIGYEAGLVLTSAVENTIIGSRSALNLTGDSNTIIGVYSSDRMGTGTANIAIGKSSMRGSATVANNTGFSNIALGNDTMSGLTSGSDNVVLGISAGLHITSGLQNTAVGNNALKAVTTTSASTAVGYGALILSTGLQNTALGNQAGELNTVGTFNVFIGAFAGDSTANNASGHFVVGSGSAPVLQYFFGKGEKHVTPVGYTLNSTGGLGTDIAGSSATIAGGIGTGAGAGGSIIFQTAKATASSSTANTLATRLSVLQDGAVDWTGIATASAPAVSAASHGTIYYDSTLQGFYYSANGAAYAALVSGGGGTIGGSIATDQIAVGSGSNTIAGSSALVWTSASGLSSNRPGVTGCEFFGLNAGNTTATGQRNVGVGTSAIAALTAGTDNTALGYSANAATAGGTDNTAIGSRALLIGNGIGNTAIGSQVLKALFSGSNNTAVGSGALAAQTAAAGNTAIGASALANYNNTGGNNTAVGTGTGATLTTGSSNILLGNGADVATSSTSNTLVIGGTSGIGTAYIGNGTTNSSPQAITINATGGSGSNIAGAAMTLAGGIGTGTGVGGAINFKTAKATTTSSTPNSLATRFSILQDGAVDWTGIATASSPAVSAANHGTIFYDSTLQAFYASANGAAYALLGGFGGSIASTQVAVGSGTNTIAGSASLVWASATGLSANRTAALRNEAFGNNAGRVLGSGTDTTCVGNAAGTALTSGGNHTFVGSLAGTTMAAGTDGTGIGYSALTLATGSNNTAVGSRAGDAISTGARNTVMGVDAFGGATTTSDTVAIGYQAALVSNGSQSVYIGSGAGATFAGTFGSNVVIGYQAGGGSGASASSVTLVGNQAGSLCQASGTTAVGNSALGSLTTGLRNTAVGNSAAGVLVTGTDNTAMGDNALTLGTGSNNTVVGSTSGNHISTGHSNTIVGSNSGKVTTTGIGNIFLGIGAGDTTAAGASNRFVAGSGTQPILDVWFGGGEASGGPSDYTIHGGDSSGTNVDGASLIIAGGVSTGTGVGGQVIFKTAKASGSGSSSPNTLVIRLSILQDGGVDWTGVATGAVAVSAANHGTIFYNSTLQGFYLSANGAAYTALGTIGGSIAANRVAYGSGTNSITGASTFTYDGTDLRLNSSTVASSSTTGGFVIGNALTAATNVGIGGGLIYSGSSIFAGVGTGITEVRVNGSNSGTAGGGRLSALVGGSFVVSTGNKSCILGGAYDGTAYFYSNGLLEFSNRLLVTIGTAASSSITGSIVIGDGVTAATNVGIGGGKLYTGGTATFGGNVLNDTGSSPAQMWILADNATSAELAFYNRTPAGFSIARPAGTSNLSFYATAAGFVFNLVNASFATGNASLFYTTSASSTITGGLVIGDGSTAATNVGIGGGSIYAGTSISVQNAGVNNPAALFLNSTVATRQIGLGFYELAAAKWYFYKESDQTLRIYDAVNSVERVRLTAGTVSTGYTNVYGTLTPTNTVSGALIIGDGSTVASNVGIGGGSVWAGTQFIVKSVGGGNALFKLDSTTASQQTGITFADAGVDKWIFFKSAAHVLSLYDAVNTINFVTFTGGTVTAGIVNVVLNTATSSPTTGALVIGNGTAATNVGIGGGKIFAGAGIFSISASGGIGYATGAGAAVTQITSRTTGVTINAICGAITLVSAVASTSPLTFTVTNSAVTALDVVHIVQKSGTDTYKFHVTNVANGSFKITFATNTGTTTEQPVFTFAIIKAVLS